MSAPTGALTPTVAAEVRAWVAADPDPTTAAELTDLLARAEAGDPAATADLLDRFAGPLEFGTAGLRGPLGGGPRRMNRAVVMRTAAALADYLGGALAGRSPDVPPRVVIGYDARHRSDTFATDTAAVLTAAGVEALLLPAPLPTPVLAFAVRHLSADAGVMVTASHNPAQDSGYKVYLGGAVATGPGQGVQIVPPADVEIAARIAATTAPVPRADDGWTVLGDEVRAAYVDRVVSRAAPGPRDLRIVHTALHGVGGRLVEEVLGRAGFTDVHPVPSQAEPDPDFPTVAYPNPEESGALDAALALAQEVGADLVLANDPDADRCAVAVPDRYSGRWRMLHGDEVGALLGDAIARRVADRPDATVASSIVSSRVLGRVAAAHRLRHVTTLTGFKWIARVDGLVFGYEEAIGYCTDPDAVRDKDGISAALLVAELAADLKARGRDLVDALDDLARAHGLHLTDQLAVRTDLAQVPAVLDRLRRTPPVALAGSPVTEVIDLTEGGAGLPPTAGVVLRAADDTRVVVRPSGTEPKLKCYLEVIVPVAPAAPDLRAERAAARARLDALRTELDALLGL